MGHNIQQKEKKTSHNEPDLQSDPQTSKKEELEISYTMPKTCLPSPSLSGEIIESSGRPRHLSIISLKNLHLFKIIESVINFYLKKNF